MRIGIIGCGIGGLAAASLLAREGHDVTVLERFAAPRPLGAGLLLQPSGLAALDCMGLGDAARAMGAKVDKLEGRTTKGRLVLNLVYERWNVGAYGLGIHRAALFDILYGAARDAGAQIVTEADILRIENSEAPWAIDAKGRAHGPFQLLIAADGSASTAREQINPKAKAPLYAWGALWAAFPAPDDTWEGCLTQRYQSASVMMGVLPIGRAPDAGDQRHLAFFWSLRRDAFEQWQAEGFDFFKARVAALWPEAGRLLAPQADSAIFAQATYRDVAARPWRKDRTLLIGDSAHGTSPQLGQGANLALIDALELSAATAANQVDVALDAYVARRGAHVRWYPDDVRGADPRVSKPVRHYRRLTRPLHGADVRNPFDAPADAGDFVRRRPAALAQLVAARTQVMRTLDDIIAFIAGQCDICDALRAVAALDLPDAWIAAGFIRAAIWDHLHARPYARPHGDVDVIYFDPVHIDPNADAAIEDTLRAAAPSYDWSVKNQALMHARNGDAPYGDSANAMTHWPERCTAIAARWTGNGIVMLAPFGAEDIVRMRVQPTPAFARKSWLYRQRIIDKAWRDHWPLVDVFDA